MKVRLRSEKIVALLGLIFEDKLVTGHRIKRQRLNKVIDELFVNF